MGHHSYVDLVKQHFSFLNSDYGFSGPYQVSDDSDSISIGIDTVVEYRSQTTIVTIERDRYGALGIVLRPITETRGLSLGWIVEFFAGMTEVLDVEPYVPAERMDSSKTTQNFLQFMKAYYAGEDTTPFKAQLSPDEVRRREAWQVYRLRVYATALQQYGDIFLHGDFSKWIEVNDYVERKVEKDYQTMIEQRKQHRWLKFPKYLKQRLLDLCHLGKE